MFKIMILALMCAGTALRPALAQNSSGNEVGLLLGAPYTPDLTPAAQPARITFGTGITFQATYARRFARLNAAALYFELPFAAAPKVDASSNTNGVPANYASIFITPGLRLKLRPNAGVSPWLAVGGGYARFHESAELQDGSPNPGRIGANRGAAQFGGGLDFRAPVKVLFPIGLRVEIRDFYSGRPNYNQPIGGGFQHNLLFSGGLVLTF